MDFRSAINLVERSGLGGLEAITPEQVIAYCRDPRHDDVHTVYAEHIEVAFDGGQEELDAWVIDMVDHIKAKVAEHVTNRTYMYRGFQHDPSEPLGVHWTTSERIAQQFAQGGTVLTAYIDPNVINWLGTVVRGIFFDNDNEDELYLIPDSEITLLGGYKRTV